MDTKSEQVRYQSFLLRVQWVTDFEQIIPRLSLENVITHERYTFSAIDGFCQFLEDQLKPSQKNDS